MSSRKLSVTNVKVETIGVVSSAKPGKSVECSRVSITFSRKLTQLEVSGVCAVLEGQIK